MGAARIKQVPNGAIFDGPVLSKTGVGYQTGDGGSVTQATDKTTGVTLSKPSGKVTMHNAALNAATIVSTC
jgi:hypothetical protein